jgi:hypothetical protein
MKYALTSTVASPTRRESFVDFSRINMRIPGFCRNSSVAVAAPESAPPMITTS